MAHELRMHLHDYVGWPGPVTARQHEAWFAWLALDAERKAEAAGRHGGGHPTGAPPDPYAEAAMRQQERRNKPGVLVVTKTRTEVAEAGGPEAAGIAALIQRGKDAAAKRDRERATKGTAP